MRSIEEIHRSIEEIQKELSATYKRDRLERVGTTRVHEDGLEVTVACVSSECGTPHDVMMEWHEVRACAHDLIPPWWTDAGDRFWADVPCPDCGTRLPAYLTSLDAIEALRNYGHKEEG